MNKTAIPYALYSETGKIVGYGLAYGLISILALIGNLMVVMVVFMNKNMRTATNVLLLNLSLSDISFVVFAVPGLVQSEICNDRWVLGEIMARVTPIATIGCAASSIFTMMAIALERYFAVVHPLKQMARKKKCTVVSAIIIIWACAIAMSIPTALYVTLVRRKITVIRDGVVTNERQMIYFLSSTMGKEAKKAEAMSIFVLLNVIPILVLSYFYARIVWKLWNPDKQLTQQYAGTQRHKGPNNFVAKARRKTTIMLLVVLSVFFVLMFPYNLFNIVYIYVGSKSLNKDVLKIANSFLRILLVLNSATNPIIYNFLSEKFRTGFRQIFSCRWRKTTRVEATTDGETVLT